MEIDQKRKENQTIKTFFARNIDNQGRLLRGLAALGLFVGAWFAFGVAIWLGLLCVSFGAFTLFEGLRGWCVLRACGVKTRH